MAEQLTRANEARHWQEWATNEEREICPGCGIAWYWLARSGQNREFLDRSCAHPFHESVPKVPRP